MSNDDLKARLQGHTKAFEGLMSLIPAEYYYGKDNDDQWRKRKQSKEQKREAKRAKLDPDSYKSALDVHRERKMKRKREDEGDDERDGENTVEEPAEQPKEGMKHPKQPSKKRKTENDETSKSKTSNGSEQDEATKRKAKAERRKEKRDRKKIQKARAQEKKAVKKARKAESASSGNNVALEKSIKAADSFDSDADQERSVDDDQGKEETAVAQLGSFEDQGPPESERSHPSSPEPATPTFDQSAHHSSASSNSSIAPPSAPDNEIKEAITLPEPEEASLPSKPGQVQKSSQDQNDLSEDDSDHEKPREKSKSRSSHPKLKLPEMDREEAREKLRARLAELRAARNADGLDGKPAKTRQEFIEARRLKEAQRKAHKKELRAKAKEDELATAEAEAARLRGTSNSPLFSTPDTTYKSKTQSNNFSYGSVQFDDGAHVDSNLDSVSEQKNKKGPSDPKTALEAARSKQKRLNSLDEQKRAEIEEKDMWLNAKKKVHGEKVRDNENLLKKALKRKEKAKSKSEKDWHDREEGVRKGKEARQRKRENNLQKRMEEKNKGKRKFKPVIKPGPKPLRRPGFEGSFKTGAKREMFK